MSRNTKKKLAAVMFCKFNNYDSFVNSDKNLAVKILSDYDSVLKNMRLDDGTLWPIPICLDIDKNSIDLFSCPSPNPLGLPHSGLKEKPCP